MTVRYMWRYTKECMIYLRLNYWHKNKWNNDWHSMGIGKASRPPGCGHRTHRKYNFVSSWITLASNMLVDTMLNTSNRSLNSITKSQQIGGGQIMLASPLTGSIKPNRSTSQCWGKLQKP